MTDFTLLRDQELAERLLEDKYQLAREIWESKYTNFIRWEYTTYYQDYLREKQELTDYWAARKEQDDLNRFRADWGVY